MLLAISLTMLLLSLIHRYCAGLNHRTAIAGPFAVEDNEPPTVLVAYEGRRRTTDRALRFAVTLSPDVVAVHLLRLSGPKTDEDVAALKAAFERDIEAPLRAAGDAPPRLVAIPAPYCEIHAPLLDLVNKIDADTPGRSVAILIPELVLGHWWEKPLHSRRGARLRAALLTHAGPRLMVIASPWRS